MRVCVGECGCTCIHALCAHVPIIVCICISYAYIYVHTYVCLACVSIGTCSYKATELYEHHSSSLLLVIITTSKN